MKLIIKIIFIPIVLAILAITIFEVLVISSLSVLITGKAHEPICIKLFPKINQITA